MADQLADGHINKEMGQLRYMADSNHLGCQNGRFLCGTILGFQRGGGISRSLANQRVAAQQNSVIAEVKKGVDDRWD